MLDAAGAPLLTLYRPLTLGVSEVSPSFLWSSAVSQIFCFGAASMRMIGRIFQARSHITVKKCSGQGSRRILIKQGRKLSQDANCIH